MKGKGILYYPNGKRYEGNFADTKKNGEGIYYWSDGLVYDGKWNNDQIDSHGHFYEPVSMKFGVIGNVENHLDKNFTYSVDKVSKCEWKNGNVVNTFI